ncbi:MAG: HAMP domain-containing protein [Patescibacteria group bacterium]|nr:HAMP domain-containing protein [Patescibacteria group bacterium]
MFKKSLKIKIIFYFIPLVLLTSFAFLFFYLFRSNLVIKEGVTETGFRLVSDLSYSSELAISMEDGFLLQPAFVEGIFNEKEVVFVAVYDRRGNIIISKTKIDIEEGISEDILREVSSTKMPLQKISYSDQGEEVYEFYSPILIGKESFSSGENISGNVVGFGRVSLSLGKIEEERKRAISLGFSITGLVIILGLLISVLLAERIVKPIKLFTKATEEISKGNLDYAFKIKTGDEIEQLSENFGQMTRSLKKSQQELEEARDVLEVRIKARTHELEEQAEGLDEQVKIRTKELQGRLNELERFHKLTVGRELKMIELKGKIKELEEEIKLSLEKGTTNSLTKKDEKV